MHAYPRDDSVNDGAGSPNPSLIAAFNATQIVALVLLVLILLPTILSPYVHRSVAWINIIISWIYSCVGFLLIIGHQYGKEPPFKLCLAQSLMIYSAPAMNASACLAFALELFLNVRSSLEGRPWRGKLLLAIFPYIVPLMICIEVFVLGITNRNGVSKNLPSMYCHLESSLPSQITGAVVILFELAIFPVVGMTTVFFYRNWHAFRSMQIRQSVVPLRMIIRFAIFCLLPIPVLALSFCILKFPDSSTAEETGILTVAIGTLPIAASLIFGTSADLFRAWMFWKKDEPPFRRNASVRSAPRPPMSVTKPPLTKERPLRRPLPDVIDIA
ncbi:hypothetical protein HGRIS_003430 [Hohenbuehelia grisea]|uniref:Uncharacterized protein n=1 Tax=Hohenbuehelia grisea TaxID=104357 RepID=A0ABR3JFF0_9AGAR